MAFSAGIALVFAAVSAGGPASAPASAPAAGPAAGADRVRVEPPDSGAVLINPDMGWVFHHYDNAVWQYGAKLGDRYVCDDFPGVSVVYLRLAWSYLEPAEGQFNWSYVDKIAQRYIDAGKRVAFRFSCSETPIRYATPEWVRQAGAKGDDWQPDKGKVEGGAFWAPRYDDPVFLAKLDRFLAAAGARYDGDPNVAFVDIGSFGVWGEGHTGMTGVRYDPDVVIRHIDLHLKHFRKTLLVAQDDWPGRSRLGELQRAGAEIEMPARILTGPEMRGKSFPVMVGLYRRGNADDPWGRSLPRGPHDDRRVRVGTLRVGADGQISLEPPAAPAGAAATSPAAGAEAGLYSVRPSGPIRIDGHGCFIPLRWTVHAPLPAGSLPFCHINAGGHMQGHVVSDDFLAQAYARSKGLSLRDDSILVQPPPRAYFNSWMAREVWPRVPVVLESGHYGDSRDSGNWGDGSWYLQSVEDYHASYVSIHWSPKPFLDENRDLVRRISLRMGYRLQAVRADWPAAVRPGQTIELRSAWRNAGVAPCYGGGHVCWTLKSPAGAVAGVYVDESLNVRDLAVGPPLQAASRQSAVLARLGDDARSGDAVPGGTYGVYLSVGSRQGTPIYALPLGGEDGHKRYKVGEIRVE